MLLQNLNNSWSSVVYINHKFFVLSKYRTSSKIFSYTIAQHLKRSMQLITVLEDHKEDIINLISVKIKKKKKKSETFFVKG